MRISDWSSDVCSSDLGDEHADRREQRQQREHQGHALPWAVQAERVQRHGQRGAGGRAEGQPAQHHRRGFRAGHHQVHRTEFWKSKSRPPRSEEHTSELQSLMRISYAVFCLKKKKRINKKTTKT